jgi:hypothetical protein
MVVLLALVIAGLIIATRGHGLPWRRPLRWTLILSVIPMAAFAAQSEGLLFGYSTTEAWETFAVGLVTQFLTTVGLRVGLMFLALAGLEATVPYARSLGTREGRARFGRGAVVAALTAISIIVLFAVAEQFVARAIPSAASVSIAAPSEVATPLPAVIETLQALFGAIIVSAAVALYVATIRKHAGVVTILAVFCAMVDPRATLEQAPVMLARALVVGLLVWIVARYVLDANPLAWPLTVFIASLLQVAAMLLRNHRPDLLGNAIALFVFAVLVLAYLAFSPPQRREGARSADEGSLRA